MSCIPLEYYRMSVMLVNKNEKNLKEQAVLIRNYFFEWHCKFTSPCDSTLGSWSKLEPGISKTQVRIVAASVNFSLLIIISVNNQKNQRCAKFKNTINSGCWRCITAHNSLPLSILPPPQIYVSIKTHTNLPSKSRSPKWLFPFKFLC